MRRRIVALLLALAAVFGTVAVQAIVAPQPAAADGIIGGAAQGVCNLGAGGIISGLGTITGNSELNGSAVCKEVGKEVEKKVDGAFKKIWDSFVGDWIKAAIDFAKDVIKVVLTLALRGPSLDLRATGLWGGGEVTLAGMLVWLGLVFAAVGFMWQIGKMAVTGDGKHLGRAAVGWVQNVMLSTLGVSFVAMLLQAGDQVTDGLVNATFGGGDQAYDRIVGVLVPVGIEAVSNPVMVTLGLLVLLLVGVIQMVLIFLRQSAIPIQCLLLPIAGAGRVGGDVTRQWAPRLLTSIFVIIIYKPILAIIICVGFSEFGSSTTLAEWLRGVATLVLGILAPGPLMKIFAPLGAEMGAGMAAGGMLGAAAAAGAKFGGGSGGGAGSGGSAESAPTDAVSHAQHVQQTMPKSYDDSGGGGGKGGEGAAGSDALAQASRTEAAAKVPGQSAAPEATGAAEAGAGSAVGVEATAGAGAGAAGAGAGSAAAGGAAAAAGPVGIGIAVLDGINSGVQKGASEMGGGGSEHA